MISLGGGRETPAWKCFDISCPGVYLDVMCMHLHFPKSNKNFIFQNNYRIWRCLGARVRYIFITGNNNKALAKMLLCTQSLILYVLHAKINKSEFCDVTCDMGVH